SLGGFPKNRPKTGLLNKFRRRKDRRSGRARPASDQILSSPILVQEAGLRPVFGETSQTASGTRFHYLPLLVSRMNRARTPDSPWERISHAPAHAAAAVRRGDSPRTYPQRPRPGDSRRFA